MSYAFFFVSVLKLFKINFWLTIQAIKSRVIAYPANR